MNCQFFWSTIGLKTWSVIQRLYLTIFGILLLLACVLEAAPGMLFLPVQFLTSEKLRGSKPANHTFDA